MPYFQMYFLINICRDSRNSFEGKEKTTLGSYNLFSKILGSYQCDMYYNPSSTILGSSQGDIRYNLSNTILGVGSSQGDRRYNLSNTILGSSQVIGVT